MDPPCVWALSWYGPPTIKPPPLSLDVVLPFGTPAHAEESLTSFWHGKAGSGLLCRLKKGAGNTPQHGGRLCCPGTAEKREREVKGHCRFPVLSKPLYSWTQRTKKTIFHSFPVSSCFSSVSLSARRSAWVSIDYTHTLSVTLFVTSVLRFTD